MSAALGNPMARQTQARLSSALRKTVQTWISNNNNTTALSPLEEMVLAILAVRGQCGNGGDILLKTESFGRKKITLKLFFIHTERHEEHLIINCRITNAKELFGNQFISPKTKLFSKLPFKHAVQTFLHYKSSFTIELLPRSTNIT